MISHDIYLHLKLISHAGTSMFFFFLYCGIGIYIMYGTTYFNCMLFCYLKTNTYRMQD